MRQLQRAQHGDEHVVAYACTVHIDPFPSGRFVLTLLPRQAHLLRWMSHFGNSTSTLDETKLPTNAVLILATLADGYRHGFAIRRDVESRTEGAVRLGVTTLYRMLSQLLAAGLVEESARRPLPQFDNERRRYFSITPAGRRALREEVRKLERVIAALRPVASKARP